MQISVTSVSLALVLLYSCGSCSSTNNTGASDTGTVTTASEAPVETRQPGSNYKPAFEGQTRIQGIKTKAGYGFTVVTSDLKRPWSIKVMDDGRFLVTEKEGKMRIVSASGQIGEPISGVPQVNSSGQGGLLDVVTDPDFKNNRMIYWTFSEDVQGGNLTSVAKAKLSTDDKRLENVQVIFRAMPAYQGRLHYGSRILVGKDGYLYVSTGERSDLATRPQAQHLNSALGKVIRITKDGKPAPGNPFTGRKDAMPEIYTYGHRNPQGLAFHPTTGELWLSEMGPKGGDEINRIQAGKNYGWPTITYGLEYSGKTIGEGITQKEGMEQPVYYWDPVLSPSGMTFYAGNKIAEWKNNLFICGLNSNHIARLTLKDNRVTGEERLLANEGQRFRDITEGGDGALYAVTDEGRLYKIAAK